MNITQTTQVSIDLETLGTRPGCKILSIGARVFGPAGLGGQFYIEIHRQFQGGLHEDQSTVEWWSQQSSEARRVLADDPRKPTLADALVDFNVWLGNVAQRNDDGKVQAALWGNGSDFDNSILMAAYHRVSIMPAWPFYLNRCYRTLKSLVPNCKLVRQGTYHNSLDDATSQAEHAVRLFHELGLWAAK